MWEKRMWRSIGKCVGDYRLIAHGDRIAVGVSGGKDSLALLDLLSWQRQRAPVHFNLQAITVDLGSGENFSDLQDFCAERGILCTIHPTNIAEIVFEIRRETNPCALCANLRRGALNQAARKLGCNKVALAHHLDDAIETYFLNLFYQGRMACFHPKTYLSRQRITVIRPLLYTREEQVSEFAFYRSLPIIPSRCPAAGRTKRSETKQLLSDLAGRIPDLHKQMRNALTSLWKDMPT